MSRSISLTSPSPRQYGYLKIYEQMRENICAGVYPHGSKIPSKRNTAEAFGVSLITVEHAYSLLCEEGYLTSVEKSGYYVDYRENDVVPAVSSQTQPAHWKPLSDAEAIPYPTFARTVRRVLSVYGENLLVKSPNEGLWELRSILAEYLAASRSIRVAPERIVIGSGAEDLYGTVVQLLGRTRVYGVESPCYRMIPRTYALQGVTVDALELGPEGIRSDALERTDATVLHVTPFHSFPSGVTASASKRREYLRWAAERDGCIVEDDYDSELTPSTKAEDTLFSLDPVRHVIYMNTFSQTVAPAIRAGYIVLPEALTEVYHSRLGDFSCSVPVLEQYILLELISSGDFVRHINRVRRSRRRAAEAEGTSGKQPPKTSP